MNLFKIDLDNSRNSTNTDASAQRGTGSRKNVAANTNEEQMREAI